MSVYGIESSGTLTGAVNDSENLSGAIYSSGRMSGSLQITIPIDDHRVLAYRDSPNQHPISAITSLATELENKVEVDDALSNIDIDNILRRFV